YLTDVSTYPRWQPDLIEYRLTSAGPRTTGSTGVAVRSVMGQRDESTWQVIELVPNARYTVKSTSGPLAYEIATTLEPVGDSTRVSVRFQAQPTGLLKIAEPLLASAARKGFAEGYQKLKALLEA